MDLHLRGFDKSTSRFVTRTVRKSLAFALLIGALALSMYCAPKRSYVSYPVSDWDLVERTGLEPPADLSASQKSEFQRGWNALQQGDLGACSDELEALSRRYPDSPEINTALAYLQLRLGHLDAAEQGFDAVLRQKPRFGPALSGDVLVALTEKDEEKALERLGRLEADYPQHELVDRYATPLRVNVAESRLRTARDLVRDGKYQEAAAAYLRALEVAPEAGALFLEAAQTELRASYPERAMVHARRATELEPSSADAYSVLAEACYAEDDLSGAVEALRTAASLSPGDDSIRSRLQAMESELHDKTLPPEYGAIAAADRLTREDLAALVYIGQRNAFDHTASRSSVIATDISDSWAAEYIRRAVGVGVLEVYPNHTFQPKAFVSRMDLAKALARTLRLLAPDLYSAKRAAASSEEFSDLARENVNYDAAAIAVSLGLMKRADSGEFDPQRIVTGAEAVSAVSALALDMTR